VVTLDDDRPLASVFPPIRELPGVPWDVLPALRAPLELRGWDTWESIAVRSPRELSTLKYVTPHRAAEFLGAVAKACGVDHPAGHSDAAVEQPLRNGYGRASSQHPTEGQGDDVLDPHRCTAVQGAERSEIARTLRPLLWTAALLTRRLQWTLGDERFERLASEILRTPPRADHGGGAAERWARPAGADTWRRIDSLFAGCPPPVLRARLFPRGKRATLATVGEELGVTRERVRQIERSFRDRLERAINSDLELTPIVRLAVELRNELEPILEPQDLEEALTRALAASGGAHIDEDSVRIRLGVLRELLGSFQEQQGLLISSTVAEKLDAWRSRLCESQAGELLPETLTELVAEDVGVVSSPGLTRIEQLLQLRRLGQHLVRWNVGLGDKGVAVLRDAGRPLTSEEIHEGVGYDANPRSLLNAVTSDRRVARLGKNGVS
jgi:hypothetical protein